MKSMDAQRFSQMQTCFSILFQEQKGEGKSAGKAFFEWSSMGCLGQVTHSCMKKTFYSKLRSMTRNPPFFKTLDLLFG